MTICDFHTKSVDTPPFVVPRLLNSKVKQLLISSTLSQKELDVVTPLHPVFLNVLFLGHNLGRLQLEPPVAAGRLQLELELEGRHPMSPEGLS